MYDAVPGTPHACTKQLAQHGATNAQTAVLGAVRWGRLLLDIEMARFGGGAHALGGGDAQLS